MEIIDVLTLEKVVDVKDSFRVLFKVIGAEPAGFEFPFSNESLTENRIQFIKEGYSVS